MSGCLVFAVAILIAGGVIGMSDPVTLPTSVSKSDLLLGLVVIALMLAFAGNNDCCNDSCSCRRTHMP